MKMMAGEVANAAGTYRCACCNQRHFYDEGAVIQRCKTCECSIFQGDLTAAEVHALQIHGQNSGPWL
jgi:hypothetical protein